MTTTDQDKCRKAFEEWHLEEHGGPKCRALDDCNAPFEAGWLACQAHNDAKLQAAENLIDYMSSTYDLEKYGRFKTLLNIYQRTRDGEMKDDVKCDSGLQDHKKILAKLKVAEEMIKYAGHAFACRYPTGQYEKCDCGFDEAFQQWRKANE